MTPAMRQLRCPACHAWGHALADCHDTRGAPLETPSHNGAWQGKAPVRTVPIGASGEDTNPDSDARRKAAKGHAAQSRARALRRLVQANLGRRKK